MFVNVHLDTTMLVRHNIICISPIVYNEIQSPVLRYAPRKWILISQKYLDVIFILQGNINLWSN